MSLPDAPTAYTHHIAGASTAGASAGTIERRSPGHDVPVSTYTAGSADDAHAAIAAAREAFDHGPWPHTAGAERQAVLAKTAELIRANRDELGMIECLETGKPITQARDEMDWAAGLWDYAAALARRLHGETTNTLGPNTLGLTLCEPIGVAGLITPWNFPLLIVSQKLPFALAAGCAAVVKPSEMTSGTTLRLAEILKQAGLPDGACNVVTGYGDPVGQAIVDSEHVDMISFTGSTAVGRRVAAAAGGRLAKVALELGGKNPQIVFSDADLDAAAESIVHGAYFNMGECCNAGSRLLVEASIADELVDRVVEGSRAVPIGDPLDPSVKVGAMISEAHHRKVLDAVERARDAGADVRLGGEPMGDGPGRYIEATVVDRVTPDMEIAGFEVFGPVLAVLRFEDEAEAIRLANGTAYGLSAGVWTRDADRALRLTRAIKAGTVWVNTFLEGAGELPFGGYRQSGIGRELGPHSVLEYTETKTVNLRVGPMPV